MQKLVNQTYQLAENAVESFRKQLILDEKREATIQKYTHDVRRFLSYHGKQTVCKEDVIQYKAWLAERYAVRSTNSMLIALNQFLRFQGAGDCCVKPLKVQRQTFCDKKKELSQAEYFRLLEAARRNGDMRLHLAERYAVRSTNSMLIALNQFLRFQGAGDCCVKPLKVQRQTFCDKKKELSQAEYFRLLEAARRNGDMRLHLAIQTICATGIRVSELAYITVEAARLGRAIASNKGKSRIILIPKELCRNLLDYARERGIQDGPIFVTRGGRTLNRSNIWNAMKRLCKSAQVGPEKVYPHNLRHLFARTFYKKEKDISRLADILGHENVNTTRIYVVSSGAEHREQLESLHLTVPYQAACQNQEQHNETLCY